MFAADLDRTAVQPHTLNNPNRKPKDPNMISKLNSSVRRYTIADELLLSMPAGKDPHMTYMVARFDPFAGMWDAVDRARREGRTMPVFSYAV